MTARSDDGSFNAVETVNDKAVVFLPWNTIESEAQQQILNTASMPFVFKHVAVMPDCHYGKGATVGTVLATQGAVIPAAVGVDIGCGMIAVRTPLKRIDIAAPAAVRAGIERRIPMSAGKNNAKLTTTAAERVRILEALAKETGATPDQYDKNWRLALGTLGGGNHFIELAEDGDGAVWLTLHSGSRGVGNKIGSHYIVRPGYVPGGAGILQITVTPAERGLIGLTLVDPGQVRQVHGIALASRLAERRVSDGWPRPARRRLERPLSRATSSACTIWRRAIRERISRSGPRAAVGAGLAPTAPARTDGRRKRSANSSHGRSWPILGAARRLIGTSRINWCCLPRWRMAIPTVSSHK